MPTQTTIYTDALDNNGVKRTYLNKTFYDRNLLENAKTVLCHAKYGQKRNIPKNNGKTVEFRRWTPFDPNLALGGLTEGITPDGQDLAQTNVLATVGQYGAYVEVSDLLKTSAYDDVMEGATDMLGEQMGRVVEWITRDAMAAGTNVQYVGGKTRRTELTSADIISTTEVRKAVRTLKKNKARMFTGNGRKPHFICICSPDATFDLQSDPLWQNVSVYSNAEQIYSGEIGRLFNVVFVESTEAKVFSQSVHNAVSATTTSATTFILKNAPTALEIAYLSTAGNKIKVGDTEHTVASFDKATNTVTLSAAASLTADAVVYSEDAGVLDGSTKTAADVHASLIFGKDAYGVIDIEGSGAIKTIIKGLGSAGTADPLDQRCTVGAKVTAYTAKILNNDWLVRLEHGISA